MKTAVLKDLCIGCGLCPNVAPDVYKMDDDGKAIAIKTGELSEQEAVDANEAKDSCPVEAISVE